MDEDWFAKFLESIRKQHTDRRERLEALDAQQRLIEKESAAVWSQIRAQAMAWCEQAARALDGDSFEFKPAGPTDFVVEAFTGKTKRRVRAEYNQQRRIILTIENEQLIEGNTWEFAPQVKNGEFWYVLGRSHFSAAALLQAIFSRFLDDMPKSPDAPPDTISST